MENMVNNFCLIIWEQWQIKRKLLAWVSTENYKELNKKFSKKR